MEAIISEWYKNKTKLKNVNDLLKLKTHIESFEDEVVNSLYFSTDYKFDYYDIDGMDMKKYLVRPENIFKLNFYIVAKQLKKYFPNTKIIVSFESPSENDKAIKKVACTYKHDAYIKIMDLDENFYDIGLEYFESVHNRMNDDDKEISSKVNLDAYYFYEERYGGYINFMKNTIHGILMCICALEDDPYSLSKINYFKNYKETRTLKTDTELFNQIISWKKSNQVQFDNLFENLLIVNLETKKQFEFDEFLEYLESNYDIKIEFEADTKKCDYKYFKEMINCLDSNMSPKILQYRRMYTRTMDLLLDSEKQIIEHIKKINETKKLIPKFIENFMRMHIQNYKHKDTMNKAYRLLEQKVKK